MKSLQKENNKQEECYCLLDNFKLTKDGCLYKCPWCGTIYYLAEWQGNKELRKLK